ncbi:unnamed protein product, partial [Rotaria sp. Silwood2]
MFNDNILLYGLVHFDKPEDLPRRQFLLMAIQFYEEKIRNEKESLQIAQYYINIGHWHLLLEDFSKALSAYQAAYALDTKLNQNPEFLFGLGIVYHHYGVDNHAIRAYQQVLYVDSQFLRRSDVHLRLGLIYKKLGDYTSSLKYFQRALGDSTSTCSLTRSELSYLIGFVYEQQGHLTEAENLYEKLLQQPDTIATKLEGKILRQLGWLYFYAPLTNNSNIDNLNVERENQIKKAINTLEQACKCDPTCGITYYYLGRCYAALRKHTEAFYTYRNCVDKLDQNADVWCSIGVLYQHQNQTMDALQAFVCAIQIDNKHAIAWMDLGILYETSGQAQDALFCYKKAIIDKDALSAYQAAYALDTKLNQNPEFLFGLGIVYHHYGVDNHAIRAYQQVLYVDSQFLRRSDVHLRLGLIYKKLGDYTSSLKYFQRALGDSTSTCSLTRSELSYLIGFVYEQQGHLTEAENLYEKLLQQPDTIATKLEGKILRQLGWLYFYAPLTNNSNIDNLNVERENQIKKAINTLEQACKCDPTCGITYYYLGRCYAALRKHTEAFYTYRNCVDKLDQNADVWCSIGVLYQHQNQTMDALQAFVCAIQIDNKHAIAWMDLGILYETSGQAQDALFCYKKAIIDKDESWNPELINRINQLQSCLAQIPEGAIGKQPRGPLPKVEEAFTLPIPSELTAKQQQMATTSSATTSLPIPLSTNVSNQQCSSSSETLPIPPSSVLTSNIKPSIDVVRIDKRLLTTDQSIRPKRIKLEPTVSFTSNTSSNDLQKIIKHSSSPLPPLPVSYLPDGHIPKLPQIPKIASLDLNPATPSVILETRREATSAQLQQYCLSQPICIVRGLANVLKLDLGLFSTKTLVESQPDHQIEVRTQRQQAIDENFDFTSMTIPLKNVWKHQSTRSYTTIAKYAQYQAYSYHDM